MKSGLDYIGISVGAFIMNEKKEVLLLKRSQGQKMREEYLKHFS